MENKTIHVLRKDLMIFMVNGLLTQPSSSLNVKTEEINIFKNKFLLVRQLHYSPIIITIDRGIYKWNSNLQ